MDGDPMAAAELWAMTGSPYEIAIALAHSDQTAQLEALEVLDALGASAVAAKLIKALRDQGVSAPRGKSRTTRDHAAGLTASQAEVLQLLDEGLSNTEIADRLFVSHEPSKTTYRRSSQNWTPTHDRKPSPEPTLKDSSPQRPPNS